MTENTTTTIVDQAVAEGGAYEVLRRRLQDQGAKLTELANELNSKRLAEFGDSRMELAGRARIRSENNAVGRDIVRVGDLLVFGYNVFLGLKTTTSVSDVFGLYHLVETAGGYDVSPVDHAGTFLADPGFLRDFTELYSYFKDARLIQLMVSESKLLAAFQIGAQNTDQRVFRWNIASTGEVSYIDMRGDRDIAPPPPFDFKWKRATKDLEVSGRFPHLNILDKLFVETTGGDLTLKVENNTETGQGVYSEPVDDKTQSLDDASVEYAKVGSLILLRVTPYRETEVRGLVFNSNNNQVVRQDAINQACVSLPEDHGIIFPGGYYLQNGEHKSFDASIAGMSFKRSIRSPNGEDVLYVFYDPNTGTSALLVYNMVRRELMPPIFAHGYARLGDGRMVLFHAENDDPTRIHQLQVWKTPFFSDEHAATAPTSTTPFGRIGNAELVRAISDVYDLSRSIMSNEVSSRRYQDLAGATRRLFDAHHWITNGQGGGLDALLHEVSGTSESILDEFEKVQQIRRHSEESLTSVRNETKSLLSRLNPDAWTQTQEFVDSLSEIVALRGRLLSLRDYRYIDVPEIDKLSEDLAAAHDKVGVATGAYLSDPKALVPLEEKLAVIEAQSQKAETATTLKESIKAFDEMSADLDVLSELMASLRVDDATQRTRVVDLLSNLYARLNQSKARTAQRRKALGSSEAIAQFSAQFTLFGQSVANSLGLSTSPEKADEQLARLMVQLEELESQFGEFDQFLGDILSKREELLETFEAHKQSLLDDRQRKAQSVFDAATRILEGLGRRAERFQTVDELNAFFVGDALVQKLRELVARLRTLRDSVRADDIESKIKASRDQTVRALRDRTELFEDGGNVIKLGPRHRFSVNTQPLDLTLLPRGDHLSLHLTGTDYQEELKDSSLDAYRAYWSTALESESPNLYRGEYLACQVYDAAVAGTDGLSMETLRAVSAKASDLEPLVRDFSTPRYRDGYEKGIHDHDAAIILKLLLDRVEDAGPLASVPSSRALALAFWASLPPTDRTLWEVRIAAASQVDELSSAGAIDEISQDLSGAITEMLTGYGSAFAFTATPASASRYLVSCLKVSPTLVVSSPGHHLSSELRKSALGSNVAFTQAVKALAAQRDAAVSLVSQALKALIKSNPSLASSARFLPEATMIFLYENDITMSDREVNLDIDLQGLLGQHERLVEGRVHIAVDDLLDRYYRHMEFDVPGVRAYQAARATTLALARENMHLDEFRAKPLTSFVRNRLINDVYLPVIGDNLAKQMGTVGESKRSDLMGLLMMISPPGYGKTTLMEYVASRLGLVFMKINGPSLGHSVRSLDPSQAPDATSRQELEKVNLAFEMGNNVMLYLDDIQHTHSEFLQKFISLCDGTRRIDGVWKGKTKTYDMRGKKFAVVMAGNPYTESGEAFKVPDMLANRADIYNLGDVLGGMEDTFLLSYIENSLTSNPVLAPMATRDMADLYLLLDKAIGKEVSTSTLSHPYSAAEINEIVSVLKRMLSIREIIYKVNKQYIASAAQADKYRTEPPFKLQGSYRNMNKMTEKISPAMNDDELRQLVSDHYLGESQLLTAGAEENLLKLGELRGTLSEEDTARWAKIKAEFQRAKRMGGEDTDVGARMVIQLSDISEALNAMRSLSAEPAVVKLEKLPPEETAAPAPSEQYESLLRLQEMVHELLTPKSPVAEVNENEDVSLMFERRWDDMSQAIVAAINRPVKVKVNLSGLPSAAPLSPVPQAAANPATPSPSSPAPRAILPEISPSEVSVAPVPKMDQGVPVVPPAPAASMPSHVPSRDVATRIEPLSSDFTKDMPHALVETLVQAIGAHQQPLLEALRDRLDDQAQIGRAMAMLMERVALSASFFSSSDDPVRNRNAEFEKMLKSLKFRYDIPQR